jgi:hypothetical protein
MVILVLVQAQASESRRPEPLLVPGLKDVAILLALDRTPRAVMLRATSRPMRFGERHTVSSVQ